MDEDSVVKEAVEQGGTEHRSGAPTSGRAQLSRVLKILDYGIRQLERGEIGALEASDAFFDENLSCAKSGTLRRPLCGRRRRRATGS
jgi:hypothetical protein